MTRAGRGAGRAGRALLLKLRAAGADGRTGDAESDAFLLAELAARRPGDAVLSEESPDPAGPADRRAGLDRRPARRHPGVRRGRPRTTGPCTWRSGSAASWSPAPSRCPARARCCSPPARRSRPRAAASAAADRGQPDPPAGVRRAGSPSSSAPSWSPMGSAGAKATPCCAARSTPTCTPAASTSGTRRRRSPWPARPGCTPAGSTARRCVYNQPDPLAARPARLPTRSWPTDPAAPADRPAPSTQRGAPTR